MFPAVRLTTCTISDLSLAAYLMYRGAKLEGVEVKQTFKLAVFTFSHKKLNELMNEYWQQKVVKLIPFQFLAIRDSLKRLANVPV